MKKARSRGSAPAEPAVLFCAFERSPPDGQSCLDRIYALFAEWPIQCGWCQQCFGPEWEQRMRAQADPRHAPHDSFDMIYFEHPLCSGGLSTFLHWLPRGLEVSFFDRRLSPAFQSQMARLGLLAWPEDWLKPLRQLICRVSAGWFAGAGVLPLQRLDGDKARAMTDDEIGRALISALCALRIEPQSIAEWLLEIDTAAGWYTALDLLASGRVLESPGFCLLAEEGPGADFQAAQEALDRRLRAAFHRVFSDAVLTAKWERSFSTDPQLADAISDCASFSGACCPDQGMDATRADEAAVRRVIGLQIAGL